MSKTITSPVKNYPGTVKLFDPLTFPQAIAFEDSLKNARDERESKDYTRIWYAQVPGILACVEEWHLGGGFPETPALDNFPSTPRRAVAQLIAWLVKEISCLYQESEEVPLA